MANVGAIKVNVQVKQAWWFKPFFALLCVVAVFRIVPVQRLLNIMTSAARKAYRYRMDRGEWKQLLDSDFKIDLESYHGTKAQG